MTKTNSDEQIYTIRLNRKQLKLLSQVCDMQSRDICGQLDAGVANHIDAAIFRHYQGDKQFELRKQVREMLKNISVMCWAHKDPREYYGIRYDDDADILFDMHQVLRHQLWLENPNRTEMTVDSDVHQWGDEPLIEIIKEN